MNWLRPVLGLVVIVDVVGGLAWLATMWHGDFVTRGTEWPRPLVLLTLSIIFAYVCALLVLRFGALSRMPTVGGNQTGQRLAAGPASQVYLPAVTFALAVSAAVCAFAFLLLATEGAAPSPARAPGLSGERTVTLLTINDVYRIEGLQRGAIGGLARVRTLRKELEGHAPGRVLLLHAGDLLFPSLLSRSYDGQQMIDVLNLLDGDATPGRIDERMFAVLGNHEFDKESCDKPSPLADRVAESDFFWLHSSIALTPCKGARPRLSASNLLHARIIDAGGMRIGLFGLTLKSKHPSFTFLDPLETAEILTADLRRRGADVVIALSHLSWEDDLRIYRALRSKGLDLVVGGHDHENMALPAGALEPRILKADADAATAWVLTLRLGADGQLRVERDLRHLDQSVRQDPEVAERVAAWLERHERAFCNDAGQPGGCLGAELATTKTELGASEDRIRRSETSLGNWVADRMRDAFRACSAEAAVINAGGLRLNQDVAANSAITRQHVEELLQYPTELYMVEMTGEQLQRAVTNAVSQPGAGRWLQVSGFAFVYDPTTRAVTSLAVEPTKARGAVDVMKHPTKTFRVVANKFLFEDKEEGYASILPALSKAIPCSGTPELKRIVYDALKAQPTIAPSVEGRICTSLETTKRPCQASTWLKGNSP
jgi:2',3'-cyclic-nucleotide 2'-phosphodiesterase (5'-nucleotidase family)